MSYSITQNRHDPFDVEHIRTLMRQEPDAELSTVWRNIATPAPTRKPQSNIEKMQTAIMVLYGGYGIDATVERVHYFDDDIGLFFHTNFDMFSDEGCQANQHVRNILSTQLRKKVIVGGERNGIKVWVAK